MKSRASSTAERPRPSPRPRWPRASVVSTPRICAAPMRSSRAAGREARLFSKAS